MKMYLNEQQTAKMIELGFEKPKTIVDKYYDYDAEDYKEVNHYSIGELIEMLGVHLSSIYCIGIGWVVNAEGLERRSEELIDALYDMVVKLKKEEVI